MTKHGGSPGNKLANALNRDCHCISVDKDALRNSLEAHLRGSGLPEKLLDVHSHLFADSPVFLWQGHIDRMADLIQAVETVAGNKGYQDAVLAWAPASARHDSGPRGVFFGYDFHLGEQGPQLIEINTNAGGVLLNCYLSAAQTACCPEITSFFGGKLRIEDIEDQLVAMFRAEWRLQHPHGALQTIAIVDIDPPTQFLYAEFLLFQSLFERHGIRAVITDPGELAIRENALWHGEQRIDLVYNRLTDFFLEAQESGCLLEAYQKGLAVFSPSPYLYALYAAKRNLAVLSDPDRLRAIGVDEQTIGTLSQLLPVTTVVTQDNADSLWTNRKNLFFKPAAGFGSRGVYRGAKLTRRVWQDIIHSDYVAQDVVPPSERQLTVNGEKRLFKLDIRCVTYNGDIQLVSARLYQGQATNLRTEGGGLATVFETPQGVCC
jgi:hypothetical protein